MALYAVAVAIPLLKENKIHQVESPGNVEAIRIAMEDPKARYEDVKEAIDYYWHKDVLVSEPVLLSGEPE